jgi:hypothetical protein
LRHGSDLLSLRLLLLYSRTAAIPLSKLGGFVRSARIEPAPRTPMNLCVLLGRPCDEGLSSALRIACWCTVAIITLWVTVFGPVSKRHRKSDSVRRCFSVRLGRIKRLTAEPLIRDTGWSRHHPEGLVTYACFFAILLSQNRIFRGTDTSLPAPFPGRPGLSRSLLIEKSSGTGLLEPAYLNRLT